MSKIEKAIDWMENTAGNKKHGYDQIFRWGEKGDYDCSAAVITAWDKAGVPVKKNGATYTGNLKKAFLASGFKDVTNKVNTSTGKGLKRGDVLLAEGHHVAMYCGNGKEVEASINEKGTAKGGKPGDQTGREFLIRSYRNYPWTAILRFEEETKKEPEKKIQNTTSKYYKMKVTAKSGLNIRKAPGTSSKILCAVPNGGVVVTDGTASTAGGDKWIKISYKDAVGYSLARWLVKV